MRFMFVIISPAAYEQRFRSDAEMAAVMQAHRDFTAMLRERNIPYSGDPLTSPSQATTISRDSSNEIIVSDGPFADTKETVGGYYIVDVASQDEAIELARQCPFLTAIEVRAIPDFA